MVSFVWEREREREWGRAAEEREETRKKRKRKVAGQSVAPRRLFHAPAPPRTPRRARFEARGVSG